MSNKGFSKKKEPKAVSKKTLEKWVKGANAGNIECRLKLSNYNKNIYNQYSYMEGSTMIHEKDYKPMNCCLCGKRMDFIHDTHNPQPFTPRCYAKEAQENNLPHRCCSKCNASKVMPARLYALAR